MAPRLAPVRLGDKRMVELSHITRVDYFTPDGRHVYWSTHCRHATDEDPSGHDACKATQLAPGVPRSPAQCKTCGSPCVCDCHA